MASVSWPLGTNHRTTELKPLEPFPKHPLMQKSTRGLPSFTSSDLQSVGGHDATRTVAHRASAERVGAVASRVSYCIAAPDAAAKSIVLR